MRLLAEYKTENEASALADFMEVEGIEVSLRSGAQFAVWVIEDDEVERASELLAGFTPDASLASKAAKIRKERELAAKPLPVALPKRSSGADSRGALTMVLIGISILVGLATKMGKEETELLFKLLVVPVFRQGGELMVWTAIQWDEPWRLLTPMFIHFGYVHLGFNMMWLHRFGNQIEANHGIVRFILLICVAQIAGSLAQFPISGAFFGGMSGVNYALFGFVWMQSTYGKSGYGIEPLTTKLLMGWLVICAFGLFGPVANACHAVGLITGLLAGLPAYVQFRNSHAPRAAIEEGSWAALNLTPWQRFERTYVAPFVPLWFMAVAIGVLLFDF